MILSMHPSWITLVLMLVGAAIAAGACVVMLMAWALTHPPRMTDGKAAWVLRRLSPADLGFQFQEMSLEVREPSGKRLKLAAWWIPHPNGVGRCAMLVHGYADAKVGAIAWAPLWHGLGFNLIVPDLRAHGESEGTVCTAGYLERSDLSQLLDQLRAEKPQDTRQIVLFGVSLGAAVAAATAIEASDIAAVVMDSPYADFRNAAMAHMDRVGAPGRFLQRQAIRLAEWLTQADYDEVRPVDLIARLPCPVLVIVSGNDPFIGPDDRQMLDRAVAAHPPDRGHAELRVVQGVEHLMAISADPEEYQTIVGTFLASLSVAINSSPSCAS
jgi:hypothetical protein